MSKNTIGGIAVPRLTAQLDSILKVGGRAIRRWRLTFSYLTQEQYEAVSTLVRQVAVADVPRSVNGTAQVFGGAAVSLHLAEWAESEFASVYILADSFTADRTPFGDGSRWHRSGRTIEIEVEEA